ncbi:MAG: hypothetical protein JSS46_12735 [Proteobacteria bacterium]|jgi:hypothetical protein|nr:hypothetical protein [Pseudomonadota bacterium]
MALHPAFPRSPYDIPQPGERWFPADEALKTLFAADRKWRGEGQSSIFGQAPRRP